MRTADENYLKLASPASHNDFHSPFPHRLLGRIDRVRANLAAEYQEPLAGYQHLLHLALNEAEAVAWQSGFPHLLFPVLAQEKAESLVAWSRRQKDRRRRDLTLALAA